MTNALPNISSVKVTQGDVRQRANLLDRVRFPACFATRSDVMGVCVRVRMLVFRRYSAARGVIVPSGQRFSWRGWQWPAIGMRWYVVSGVESAWGRGGGAGTR